MALSPSRRKRMQPGEGFHGEQGGLLARAQRPPSDRIVNTSVVVNINRFEDPPPASHWSSSKFDVRPIIFVRREYRLFLIIAKYFVWPEFTHYTIDPLL